MVLFIQGKYRFLEENDITTVDWQELNPQEPHCFFVPKDFSLKEEYERFWSVKDIFIQFSSGVKTHRDHFITGFSKEEVANRMLIFTGILDDETIKESLRLRDTRDWKLSQARTKLKDVRWTDLIIPYAYRVFDQRYICYSTDLIDRGCNRYELMKNFFEENVGLVTTRQIASLPFNHALVSKYVSDMCFISTKTKETSYFFPLYLYSYDDSPHPPSLLKRGTEGALIKEGEGGLVSKIPNLKSEFINALKESLGCEPTPEDIFYYIYAVLYSPAYRRKYQEFLKIDFPRIPLPGNQDIFEKLSNLGKRLVDLHLLKSEISNPQSAITTGYPIQGSDKVETIKYQSDKVYINREQYFEGIPEALWNYHIGSYQVLEKFLKDRKGRKLSMEEIQRYLRIIAAIAHPIDIQRDIDTIMSNL